MQVSERSPLSPPVTLLHLWGQLGAQHEEIPDKQKLENGHRIELKLTHQCTARIRRGKIPARLPGGKSQDRLGSAFSVPEGVEVEELEWVEEV